MASDGSITEMFQVAEVVAYSSAFVPSTFIFSGSLTDMGQYFSPDTWAAKVCNDWSTIFCQGNCLHSVKLPSNRTVYGIFILWYYSRLWAVSFLQILGWPKSAKMRALSTDRVLCQLELIIFFLLTGAYSCLRVEMTFARQLSFFVVTIYVPCFMIVVVSWMSFWIDHKAVSTKLAVQIMSPLDCHHDAFMFRFLLGCHSGSPHCWPCRRPKPQSTAAYLLWLTPRYTCNTSSNIFYPF